MKIVNVMNENKTKTIYLCSSQNISINISIELHTRVVNFDDFETTGTGEPCPLGKTKCCFSDRKLVKQFQVSLDGFLE